MTAPHLALFVARRLVALVVLLLVISVAVFALLDAAPGSTEQTLLGTRPASPEAVAAIRDQYHLDEPFLAQYARWASGAVQLDLGRSITTNRPVSDTIRQRLGVTLRLGGLAFLLTMMIGIPLGVLAATRRGTLLDRVVVGAGVIGVTAPAFATGILLLYVFAVRLEWFPVFGQGSGLLGTVRHLALPAVALALTALALVLKLTRTAVADALDRDYVAFARARGISGRRILTAYALRNALVPIVTSGGLVLAYLLGGAVLVEVTFALPGLGSLLIESVSGKDMPVVQGVALTVATTVVLINLATDVLYLLIDPRIGLERSAA